MIQFGAIPIDMLYQYWPDCLPLITSACEYNGKFDTPDDLLVLLKSDKKLLWIAKQDKIIGLIITSIAVYPERKALSIDICTGERLSEWIDNLSKVEAYGKDNGCDEMFFMCREGYATLLKDQGYKKTHIFLQKVLQ